MHQYKLRLGQRTAIASLLASGLLAGLNIVVGLLAGSTSVVAAGVEFLGDVIASSIVLLGIIAATKPADSNHPYGHGRFELVAALVVGIILVLGGGGISWHSLQKVDQIHAPPASYAIWPLIGAIVVRVAMSTIKFRVGRRIQSSSLIADAWNDTIDILSASVALTAVALTLLDPGRFLPADHYGGFAVGLFVIYVGLRVTRDAFLHLADTMPEKNLLAQIRQVALAVPGVCGVEKCFARKTGLQYHVDLHLEVHPDMTVWESHEIATQVRIRICEELDWVADVLVHVEPSPSIAPVKHR
ncbi:MAG: cation transporter [Acidobacteria bacterium]|nr:cation transporter [Acidobacteriota bacterium]